MSLELRTACKADAEAIAMLVNKAYRPSASQEIGWTHEAHLIAGERATPEQVASLLSERSVILLLCDEPQIVACVHVQENPSGADKNTDVSAYIGMLAVAPALQAQGFGKKMLLQAEKYAIEKLQASIFKMSIISSRPELLAFYERHGYVLTGEVEEYPIFAGVGQPMMDGIYVLSLMKMPV
jgi:ribosomal protein S18 acetylase RimI-like enzyme